MGSITLAPGAAPGSPAEGEIYYDSTEDKLKVRNASAFESIPSGAGTILQTQYSQVVTAMEMTSISSNTTYVLKNGTADSDLSITGWLQCSITPKSGSIIRLDTQWTGEVNPDIVQDCVLLFVRDSTSLHNVDSRNGSTTNGCRGIMTLSRSNQSGDAGSTPEQVYMTYFDTAHGGDGSTAKVYKVAFRSAAGSIDKMTSNRMLNNDYGEETGISFISATEIAG